MEDENGKRCREIFTGRRICRETHSNFRKASDRSKILLESTKDVVSNSYEVIKTLKDIGGPEIFKRFTKLESKLDESTKSIGNSLDEKFTKIENKLEEALNKQSSRIKNLKIFIIILLLISLAIIAGLVFPNYLVELNNFFFNTFR